MSGGGEGRTHPPLKSPVVWFGGKSRVAAAIWRRFGDVGNFVDPFFGSGAVLLARPHPPRTETVNDADALLSNFFRALQHDPERVAYHADHPVNEVDLHAAHLWLLARKPDVERLLADPDWYDAVAAGRWVWGLSLWIGSGWCSGRGPWRLVDGRMVKDGAGAGVERKRPHLAHGSMGVVSQNLPGVERTRPHLSWSGQGINRQLAGVSRQLPHVGGTGKGINRNLPYVSHGGRGDASAVFAPDGALLDYLCRLSDRLRRVRVCCGDWTRVVTPAVTVENGTTAVLLDPPYAGTERDPELYAHDDGDVATAVREWAIAHGDDPRYRIALCGYDAPGYEMPPSWSVYRWKSAGGYGSQGEGRGRENAGRETIWFSRFCLPERARQVGLFDEGEAG